MRLSALWEYDAGKDNFFVILRSEAEAARWLTAS